MIVGVTGGREKDGLVGGLTMADARKLVKGAMEVVLVSAMQAKEDLIVVHGGCDGFDSIVHEWCVVRARYRPYPRITVEVFPANWDQGKGAGPARNNVMVGWVVKHMDENRIWVRFPGGKGTADCAERAARYLQVVDAEILDGLRDLSEL